MAYYARKPNFNGQPLRGGDARIHAAHLVQERGYGLRADRTSFEWTREKLRIRQRHHGAMARKEERDARRARMYMFVHVHKYKKDPLGRARNPLVEHDDGRRTAEVISDYVNPIRRMKDFITVDVEAQILSSNEFNCEDNDYRVITYRDVKSNNVVCPNPIDIEQRTDDWEQPIKVYIKYHPGGATMMMQHVVDIVEDFGEFYATRYADLMEHLQVEDLGSLLPSVPAGCVETFDCQVTHIYSEFRNGKRRRPEEVFSKRGRPHKTKLVDIEGAYNDYQEVVPFEGSMAGDWHLCNYSKCRFTLRIRRLAEDAQAHVLDSFDNVRGLGKDPRPGITMNKLGHKHPGAIKYKYAQPGKYATSYETSRVPGGCCCIS